MADHSEDNPGVISYRLNVIEKHLLSMSSSMEKLVVLEQKHMETREAMARAFAVIETHDKRIRDLEGEQQVVTYTAESVEDHGKRIKKIEDEIPTLTMTRGWVISGVIGIIAILGLTASKMLFK